MPARAVAQPRAQPRLKVRIKARVKARVEARVKVRGRKETVVFIAPRDHAAQAQLVAKVIGAQLRDMRVTFQLRWVDRMAADSAGQLASAKRVAQRSRALVVVWCDFTAGVKLQLYYALPGANRVLVRTVDQAASVQGRAETMGAIVRGGVEAMLSLRRNPPPRKVVRVTRPDPPPPHPTSAARAVTGGLALGYGLGGYSTEGPRLTHAGQLALQLFVRRRWSVHLAYGAAPDIRAQSETGEATVILHRHGIRLGGGHRWAWGRLYLGVEGSFLLDLLDRRHQSSGGLNPDPNVLDVNLGLEAVVRLGYRVTPWLSLYTGVGATVMLRNRDYRVVGVAEPVLKPWAVQPHWVVGVELKVF